LRTLGAAEGEGLRRTAARREPRRRALPARRGRPRARGAPLGVPLLHGFEKRHRCRGSGWRRQGHLAFAAAV